MEDTILQQVLVYNLARLLKRTMAVASVDASQCYNRVVHTINMLTL